MKFSRCCFLLLFILFASACNRKVDADAQTTAEPTQAETEAADEASLLVRAKAAGVSDEQALAAKAEIDKVYDETAAKMDEAEKERIARDKKFKDEACVANCPED